MNEQVTQENLRQAYIAGYDAFLNKTENPYINLYLRNEWAWGFTDAMNDYNDSWEF